MFKKTLKRGHCRREGVYRPNVSEKGGPKEPPRPLTALIEKEETPDLNEAWGFHCKSLPPLQGAERVGAADQIIGRCAGQPIDRHVHGFATEVQVQSHKHARRERQNFVLEDERTAIKRDSN